MVDYCPMQVVRSPAYDYHAGHDKETSKRLNKVELNSIIIAEEAPFKGKYFLDTVHKYGAQILPLEIRK